MALAILSMAASGADVAPEIVEKAREASVPTKLDEERIRRAAEKRERKRTRRAGL